MSSICLQCNEQFQYDLVRMQEAPDIVQYAMCVAVGGVLLELFQHQRGDPGC